MGAQAYCETTEAYSVTEAWNGLYEEAGHECGYGSYNGSITTCSFNGRATRFAEKCTDAVVKKAMKYVEDHDYGKKWDASCLDLGVVGYDVIKVTKSAPKAGKKAEFRMKYNVVKSTPGKTESLAHFDTKTEADKFATDYCVKHPQGFYGISVRREPVNVNNGTATMTEFRTSIVRKTTKPKSGNFKEVHKYIFFGWASC